MFGPSNLIMLQTTCNKIPNQRQPNTLISLIKVWGRQCQIWFNSKDVRIQSTPLRAFDLPLTWQGHLTSKHHIHFLLTEKRKNVSWYLPSGASHWSGAGHVSMCQFHRRMGELVMAFSGFFSSPSREKDIRQVTNNICHSDEFYFLSLHSG